MILLSIVLFSVSLSANEISDKESVKRGEVVYKNNCAICHTVNGGSAMGPDFNIVSYTRKKKDIEGYAKDPDAFYKAFGYSAQAMPTLPLEDQEFRDVASYIDSLQPFKKWMKK